MTVLDIGRRCHVRDLSQEPRGPVRCGSPRSTSKAGRERRRRAPLVDGTASAAAARPRADRAAPRPRLAVPGAVDGRGLGHRAITSAPASSPVSASSRCRMRDHRARPHGARRRVEPLDVEEGAPRARDLAARTDCLSSTSSNPAEVTYCPGRSVHPRRPDLFHDLTALSAAGIPTVALVFGNSTAGGAYVPGMCDYSVMVERTGQGLPRRTAAGEDGHR